jgi:hypothetical protein
MSRSFTAICLHSFLLIETEVVHLGLHRLELLEVRELAEAGALLALALLALALLSRA